MRTRDVRTRESRCVWGLGRTKVQDSQRLRRGRWTGADAVTRTFKCSSAVSISLVKRRGRDYDDGYDDYDDERAAPLRSRDDTERSDNRALGHQIALAERLRNRTGHQTLK